jgi:5'-nucleotidase
VLKCDIGIINSGILNDVLKRGEITKKKLLEICSSSLNPTTMQILGKDIRGAFRASLDIDFCMQDGKEAVLEENIMQNI